MKVVLTSCPECAECGAPLHIELIPKYFDEDKQVEIPEGKVWEHPPVPKCSSSEKTFDLIADLEPAEWKL
jgi:hypothetical protein